MVPSSGRTRIALSQRADAGAEPAGSPSHPHHLPVAQLDEQRATNAKACRFDSCREGQFNLGKARVEEQCVCAAEARGRSTLPRPASLHLDICEQRDRQRRTRTWAVQTKNAGSSPVGSFNAVGSFKGRTARFERAHDGSSPSPASNDPDIAQR